MKRVFSIVLRDPNYQNDTQSFDAVVAENAEAAIKKAKSTLRRRMGTKRYRLVDSLQHIGRAT